MSQELKPAELLAEVFHARESGLLEVSQADTAWNILLEDGKLKYASCSIQSLEQLEFYLQRMGHDAAAAEVKTFSQADVFLKGDTSIIRPSLADGIIFQGITWLKARELLNAEQIIQLIQEITQDTLEPFLWLTHGTYVWFPGEPVPCLNEVVDQEPLSVDLIPLISRHQERLNGWKSCSPMVQSPYQRPYILDHRLIQTQVPSGALSPTSLNKLAQLMRGMTIRQLALLLKQDELKVAQLLFPYIKHGVVVLRDPQPPFDKLPSIPVPKQTQEELTDIQSRLNSTQLISKTYQIACIDDSPTILDEIDRFLGKNSQYSLTKIEDPIKAASIMLRLKPDLILMDITMPGINGYKLCSLFRSSEALANIPIVMVTGSKGLIDKARAKMVGATDYLTKPFDQQSLINLVEKYLD